MVEISDKIIKLIEKFIVEAKNDNIIIDSAILFGSYAKGTNTEFSDIDIAVTSNNFEGIRFKDNVSLIQSRIRSSTDIETHPFRPEDFNESNLFVKQILKYGIKII